VTVYFIRPVGKCGPVKIGHTNCADDRLRGLMAWSPEPLEIAATIEGDFKLEARFHARFKHQHSHHEWFRASDELDEVISQIATGTFDVGTLPKGGRLWEMSDACREGHEAQGYTMRANLLDKRGIPIPPEVRACLYGNGVSDEDTRRRRAIVKVFVDSVDPRPSRSAA
jgi:hypothetical protein